MARKTTDTTVTETPPADESVQLGSETPPVDAEPGVAAQPEPAVVTAEPVTPAGPPRTGGRYLFDPATGRYTDLP